MRATTAAIMVLLFAVAGAASLGADEESPGIRIVGGRHDYSFFELSPEEDDYGAILLLCQSCYHR